MTNDKKKDEEGGERERGGSSSHEGVEKVVGKPEEEKPVMTNWLGWFLRS